MFLGKQICTTNGSNLVFLDYKLTRMGAYLLFCACIVPHIMEYPHLVAAHLWMLATLRAEAGSWQVPD